MRIQGTLLAVLMIAGSFLEADCGARESHLRSLRLWRGEQSCTSCRAGAVDLMAASTVVLTLERGPRYTVEAEFEPGDEANRCIYYMVQRASWPTSPPPGYPSHEFLCTPVGQSVTSQIETAAAGSGPASMLVRVQEFDAIRREMVVEHYSRQYEVLWAAE